MIGTADKFEIKLSLFEGPFDLLLFFIERDELDIHDIPIAKITNDFLDYIHHLDHLNLEVASEFILVAAKLMRIKAKMLLPRPQLDEEGNEIDPREELVRHLLEYKRYKEVVSQIAEMEKLRLEKRKRGNLLTEIKKLSESVKLEAELQNLDLYKLLKVYQNVLDRYEIEKNRPIHEVVQYPYTIVNQKKFILSKLKRKKKASFLDFIEMMPPKVAVIYNFLAILELLQLQLINIQVGIGFNNFWVEPIEQVQAA